MRTAIALGLTLALGGSGSAHAQLIHDESVDGDLSNDPAAPTSLQFGVGSSVVRGSVISSNTPAPVGDRDYWTFTVAPRQQLIAITLAAFSTPDRAFAAVNAGSTSFVPSGTTNASFLAGALFGSPDVGANLLDLFTNTSVTVNRLSAPALGPGDYSFVIQQTSPTPTGYTLEFVLVPSPAATSMLLPLGLWCATRRRRSADHRPV